MVTSDVDCDEVGVSGEEQLVTATRSGKSRSLFANNGNLINQGQVVPEGSGEDVGQYII